MGWHEDHLQAVRERWKKKKEESKLPEAEFLELARKTLLNYGWTIEDIERILNQK